MNTCTVGYIPFQSAEFANEMNATRVEH